MATLLWTLAAIALLGLFPKIVTPFKKLFPRCSPLALGAGIVTVVLLVLYLLGKPIDSSVLATLLGGGLLAYAYKFESRNPLVALIMVLATVAVTYSVLLERWGVLLLSIGGALFLAVFLTRPAKTKKTEL